jgi:hypothetical protein
MVQAQAAPNTVRAADFILASTCVSFFLFISYLIISSRVRGGQSLKLMLLHHTMAKIFKVMTPKTGLYRPRNVLACLSLRGGNG